MNKLTEYLKQLTLSLHAETYLALANLKAKYVDLEKRFKDLSKDNKSYVAELEESLKKEHSAIVADLQDKIDNYKEKSVYPIDKYLKAHYTVIPNIAYQQKRKVEKTFYSIYLNELITPNAYEVIRFKAPLNKIKDKYDKMFALGNKLAKHTTWVDEQKLYETGDYYFFPNETLTGGRAITDCDDVSAAMASFEPEISAFCFGYYNDGVNKFGHAFPVFLYEGQLYIIETTGKAAEVVSFKDSRYDVVFIVTQFNTYRVRGGVTFGKLAEPIADL
jgi:hypothetical protein